MSSSLISALLLLTVALLGVSSLPVGREEPVFKILSLHSTRLMSVTPNGDVHAKAGDTSDPSTDFYQHTHSFPRVSYESVQSPGKFLVLDDKTGELRVQEPEDDNELFLQISHPTMFGFFALKSHANDDCFVAFDRFGSVVPDLCNPEIHNDRHTSIHVFQL